MFKNLWFVVRVSTFMFKKVISGNKPFEWYGGVETRDGKQLSYLNVSFEIKNAPKQLGTRNNKIN